MRQRSVKELELSLLGGFDLRVDGKALALSARKDRALFAYLALSAGRHHSRERLAALLWSEVNGDPRQSLRQSLSSIANALKRAHRQAAGLLNLRRDEVWLEAVGVNVDAVRLRGLLQGETATELEAASELYRGPLLEGLGPVAPALDDWLTLERERLATAVISGHRRLLDLHAAAGTPERAIPAATRLVAVDPFREEARRELMLLYAECGHTSAAIAQYEAYAALVRKELGAEPEESTRQIHRLLIEGHTPARPRSRKEMPPRMPATGRTSDDFLKTSVVILEQMPDCVVVTDLDGYIVGWNEWARRNFGYDKREVIGRKPSFLYAPGAESTMTAGLISKAVHYGRWSGVLRLFNKDGSSRLHKRTMMPLRDEGGRIVGVFGVTRPLTRPIPGL